MTDTPRAIARRDGVRPAMTALAVTFPTFRDMDALERKDAGIDPWDAKKLAAWTAGPAPGSGGEAAGRFLLMVWNRHKWPGLEGFHLRDFGSWDEGHRAAFAAWAAEMWFA